MSSQEKDMQAEIERLNISLDAANGVVKAVIRGEAWEGANGMRNEIVTKVNNWREKRGEPPVAIIK